MIEGRDAAVLGGLTSPLFPLKKYFTKDRFTGGMRLRSLVKLIGGKTKVRDFLYYLFPKDYDCYIEPFLGSGTVLIGSNRAKMEIVGDINRSAVEFFRCLQRFPDSLYQAIRERVSIIEDGGGDAWKKIRDNEPSLEYQIDHAAWFYVLTKYSMNGIFRRRQDGKCNSSWCKTVKGRGIVTREWFDLVYDRIKTVQFFFKDYRELLKYAEAPGRPEVSKTFVYLDPPYFAKSKKTPDGCVTTYNGIRFGEEEHEELALILRKANFQWMLTINDSEVVRSLYRGFVLIPHTPIYSCSQTPQGRGPRSELVICNYDPRRDINKSKDDRRMDNLSTPR